MIANPITRTNIPIIVYSLLYIYINAEIAFVLFVASGLYKKLVTATPIPKSAKFNNCKIFKNTELYPKYSTPI